MIERIPVFMLRVKLMKLGVDSSLMKVEATKADPSGINSISKLDISEKASALIMR